MVDRFQKSRACFYFTEAVISLSLLLSYSSKPFIQSLFVYFWSSNSIVTPVILKDFPEKFKIYEIVSKSVLSILGVISLFLPKTILTTTITVAIFAGINSYFYTKLWWMKRRIEQRLINGEQNLTDPIIFDKELENKNCPICIDDFNDTEAIIKLKSCGHSFHRDCFSNFYTFSLNNENRDVRCPVCRAIVQNRV